MKQKLVFFLFLLVSGFWFLASPVFAKDYSFPQVSFEVWLKPDGSAVVEERRTYKFDGDFSFAFLYINKDARSQMPEANNEIKEIKIGDESGWYEQLESESAGSYFVRDEGSRYYVKWFYKAADTTKTFTISYTINNAVLAHKDIAEFYWKLVGDEWDKGIGFVEAKIYLPEGGFENSSGGENGTENIHGFGHGTLNGKVDILSKSQVNFSAQNLPSK